MTFLDRLASALNDVFDAPIVATIGHVDVYQHKNGWYKIEGMSGKVRGYKNAIHRAELLNTSINKLHARNQTPCECTGIEETP